MMSDYRQLNIGSATAIIDKEPILW
jgi:hypothetical protein